MSEDPTKIAVSEGIASIMVVAALENRPYTAKESLLLDAMVDYMINPCVGLLEFRIARANNDPKRMAEVVRMYHNDLVGA